MPRNTKTASMRRTRQKNRALSRARLRYPTAKKSTRKTATARRRRSMGGTGSPLYGLSTIGSRHQYCLPEDTPDSKKAKTAKPTDETIEYFILSFIEKINEFDRPRTLKHTVSYVKRYLANKWAPKNIMNRCCYTLDDLTGPIQTYINLFGAYETQTHKAVEAYQQFLRSYYLRQKHNATAVLELWPCGPRSDDETDDRYWQKTRSSLNSKVDDKALGDYAYELDNELKLWKTARKPLLELEIAVEHSIEIDQGSEEIDGTYWAKHPAHDDYNYGLQTNSTKAFIFQKEGVGGKKISLKNDDRKSCFWYWNNDGRHRLGERKYSKMFYDGHSLVPPAAKCEPPDMNHEEICLQQLLNIDKMLKDRPEGIPQCYLPETYRIKPYTAVSAVSAGRMAILDKDAGLLRFMDGGKCPVQPDATVAKLKSIHNLQAIFIPGQEEALQDCQICDAVECAAAEKKE